MPTSVDPSSIRVGLRPEGSHRSLRSMQGSCFEPLTVSSTCEFLLLPSVVGDDAVCPMRFQPRRCYYDKQFLLSLSSSCWSLAGRVRVDSDVVTNRFLCEKRSDTTIQLICKWRCFSAATVWPRFCTVFNELIW